MMLRVCALVALAAGPVAARAEPTSPGRAGPAKAAPKPAKPKTEGKARPDGKASGKVLRFSDDVVIEGKVHKPSAFYVLQRSSVEYQWEQLREAFLPKILESVKAAPF